MDASKFVFVVYSCHKNLDPYAFAVYDLIHGTFPEMPIYILYGDPKLDVPYKTMTLGDARNYLVVHVKDTYESLNLKTIAMLKAIHGLHHDYIGVFKCDDDVLVNTEQLLRLMLTLHKEPHHYIGVRIRNDKEKIGDQKYRQPSTMPMRRVVHQQETVVPVCEYAGGPIYYLSRTAVTHLASNSNRLVWKLYEDLMVGLNLQAAGFRLSPMSIYTEHIMMKNTVSYHDKNRFPNKIIFPHLQGGLANQLFQIFATMTMASKLGFTAVLHSAANKGAAHGATLPVVRKILPQLKVIDAPARIEAYHNFVYYEAANDCFRDKTQHIIDIVGPHISTASLHGYFIAAPYVQDTYVNMLKLQPSNPQLPTLTWDNTFFLHVRLGDYKSIAMYQIPLTVYYEQCIRQIITAFHTPQRPVTFYVCTNEVSPFFQKIVQGFPQVAGVKFIVQAATDNAVDTLYIMQHCQGGICSNSTLSWIGAFLVRSEFRNKQRVFMPAPWLKVPNPLRLQAADMQDVYPSWTTVFDTTTNQFAL
jgi:hypothetical protein